MGLGMALPAELTDQERQRILAAAGRLEHVCLQRQLGVWRVAPVLDTGPISQSLHSLTWTQAATRWSTVTPILLDRFPKEKQEGRRAVEVIVTSCERIEVPRPISVEYGPYSAWKGVPPVPQFRLLRRPEDRPRWAVHATLTFKDPVRGPLLLGAGRYFGMGLMRPHLTESAL